MSTSAEITRQAGASAPEQGFTLLEIMTSVFIIAIVLLPMLQVREEAQQRAFRSERMLDAANIAQEFLAVRARDLLSVEDERGIIEENPVYSYEFTLENYDLSTGYGEDESRDDPYADYAGQVPGDAQAPDEQEERTVYKLRRYELTLTWEGYSEDSEDLTYTIEGFLPRIWDPETSSLDPSAAENDDP